MVASRTEILRMAAVDIPPEPQGFAARPKAVDQIQERWQERHGSDMTTLAFADPPYLGCCGLYGHRHEAPWGCWDDPETHRELIDHLAGFDGWAYCMTSTSLGTILPMAAGARVAAWTKPFAAYKANVRIAYTWEPVLFVPGRDRSADGAPVGRDHLARVITLKKGLTGAKPPEFCAWVLDLLGYVEGDELIDLFPGTGVMSRVMAQGRLSVIADREPVAVNGCFWPESDAQP